MHRPSGAMFAAIALALTPLPGAAMADDPQRQPNRLIHETSPYLLQHAFNPVDWRPWGEEAFAEARERGVPIFLSIGYSTCYWCHVMERESFEHEGVARVLNRYFVPIKVDREQRPDVDQIYMQAVQTLTGSGGWPLSVFLTPPGARGEDDPGLEAFWGGTYFPMDQHPSVPTFPRVLEAMINAWKDRRDEALTQAASVTEAVRAELAARTAPVRLGPEHLAYAANALLQVHDSREGGFGRAPKFPQASILELLLHARPYTGEAGTRERVDDALRLTLDRMAIGGINDQVGGGFHRYSVDAYWRVPHFEKMLYDNAQLAGVYARASRVFDDPFYARVARQTLDYVLREMTGPDGLFSSAQDAEAGAREGANYVWTREQAAGALEGDDLDFALDVFNLRAGANFRDPHHPGDGASNVLYLSARPDALARERDVEPEAFIEQLDRVRAALLDARAGRVQPTTDDKAIGAWNGMMIGALADASVILDEPRYLDAARRAAREIVEGFRDGDALRRVRRAGVLSGDALLEDYAHLIAGLIAVHRAGDSDTWALEQAVRLAGEARSRFADSETGAYHDTTAGRADLLVRARAVDDGAMPAASGVMLHALLDLYELTGEESFRDEAGRLLASKSRDIAESPVRTVNSVRALVRVMADHPGMFETHAFGAGAQTLEERVEAEAEQDPIRIFSSVDSVVVPPQGFGELTLRIELAPGHHLNAPEPGVPGLTGLKVSLTNVTGLEAVPDYPEPVLYEGVAVNPNSEDRLMVYTGTVEIPVKIVRTGAFVAGEARLEIAYQVCTDTACLAARVGTLDVRIVAE